jgi:phosphate transport system protein
MTRETYIRHLHQLQDEVLLLGSMVEQSTLQSIRALTERNLELAEKIIEEDTTINEKRYAIENGILILIATQQPMAKDLRLLASILEVIIELERMGDYSKGIAKVVIRLEDIEIPAPLREIESMANLAIGMLHRALSAFITENVSESYKIAREDDLVDNLYHKAYRHIVTTMIANPELIDHANLLIWVCHNLERMADRVTNICERTIFIATGELLELDSDDSEDTE